LRRGDALPLQKVSKAGEHGQQGQSAVLKKLIGVGCTVAWDRKEKTHIS